MMLVSPMKEMNHTLHVDVQWGRIEDFCRRWKIKEFSLFGSVLTDEFRSDSDVDVLIRFLSNTGWSLYDWVDMREELQEIFGRKVDLVAEEGLRNPFFIESINNNRKTLYVSSED